MQNIIPINDLQEHKEDTTCACHPQTIEEAGQLIVVHNAFDGREGLELASEILTPVDPGYSWVNLQLWINAQYQKGRIQQFGQAIYDAAQEINRRQTDELYEEIESLRAQLRERDSRQVAPD